MILRILFLLLFSTLALAKEPIHIVFDIDWTLVYPLEEKPNYTDSQVIQIENKWYRFTDFSGETLEKLSQLPDVKISFFSGGLAERNRELLSKLILPSGKSAEQIAFKILNFNDLTEIDKNTKKKIH